MRDTSNPLPDLSELLISVARVDGAEQRSLIATLRLGSLELQSDEVNFIIQAQAATLAVDPGNFSIVEGSRLNEPKRPHSVPIAKKSTEQTTSNVRGKTDGSLNLTNLVASQAGVSGSIEASRSRDCQQEFSEIYNHLTVKARGNNNWEVREHSSALLDGTYLTEEKLCDMNVRGRPNRLTASVRLAVRQRDLKFKPVDGSAPSWWKPERKREAVANLLMSKAVHERSTAKNGRYNGLIILSKAEARDEG